LGVALLATVGAGYYKSVEEACEATVSTTTRTSPIEENKKTYRKYYPVYQSLYKNLKEDFRKLI
ncbi:MAG: hypothetical protein N2258_00335, partial [Brevinematales bacterium]|nr:hypothetical protein [Brevinematales bacterium]